jgi:hypothetical protein
MFKVKTGYKIDITELNPDFLEILLESICERSYYRQSGYDSNLMIKLNRRISDKLSLKNSDIPQIYSRLNDRGNGIELTYENLNLENVDASQFRKIVKTELERVAKELDMEPYEDENNIAFLVEKHASSKI